MKRGRGALGTAGNKCMAFTSMPYTKLPTPGNCKLQMV